ncbi:sensor histidine kinase [Plantactinospora sonchi]|uniref:histidine kinase n=1 Tax=Plantactinospora sonchi TaxID=1544735 RepID=A0ABU7S3Y6_9ACTN
MRRWMVDAGILAITGAVTGYRLAVTDAAPGDQAADPWAYGIGLLMTLALLGRRRWPALVLAVVSGLFLLYHVWHYPGGAPAPPIWVALCSVALADRRRPGLVLAGLFILFDLHSRMVVEGVEPLTATLDGSTLVFLAALLLGESIRSRRIRLALVAAERDRAVERRLVEERLRIARELHDVTAHTLAVVGVQAGVAAEVLEEDPAQARAALEEVRRASREAMVELRAAVGVLRDGTRATDPTDGTGPERARLLGSDPEGLGLPGTDEERVGLSGTGPGQVGFPGTGSVGGSSAVRVGPVGPRRPPSDVPSPPPPVPVLDRLPALVAATGAVLARDGEPRPLPRAVEATAYRIVQEAVANAVRHADAGRIEVRLGYRADGLTVTVRDDGRGATGPPGNGLRGMTERATGLGGWLRAGPAEGGGFQVRGWLPG